MCELEKYEWCDFWCQEPKDKMKPRILLIGDSITRAYRPFVEKHMEGKYYVDMIATSKALDNPAYKLDIQYLTEQYSTKYCTIHFNNGLHGFHLSTNDYGEHMEDIILFLSSHFRPNKLILATSTPVLRPGSTIEVDENLNSIILERNKVVIELALKYQLTVSGLYFEMMGKNQYRLEDGFHYNDLGQEAQGKIVAGIITGIF
jgi:hypothetical protein